MTGDWVGGGGTKSYDGEKSGPLLSVNYSMMFSDRKSKAQKYVLYVSEHKFYIQCTWILYNYNPVSILDGPLKSFNPFHIHQKWKPCYILRGFLRLWKKMPWYVLRGPCCPSSRVWQPAADSNGCLAHLLGRVWQPAADYRGCLVVKF